MLTFGHFKSTHYYLLDRFIRNGCCVVGLAVSVQYAKLGANVVLVCRSEKSCAAAAEEVRESAVEGAAISHETADFTNLIEVSKRASSARRLNCI